MRAMLINPKFRLPIDTRTTPHLGLAYLGAVTEEAGYEVCIFDADVEDEPIAEAIRRYDPDIVGITSMTHEIKMAAKFVGLIKKYLKAVYIIGGCHVTAMTKETLMEFEEFDYGVYGEGELTMLQLLQYLFLSTRY